MENEDAKKIFENAGKEDGLEIWRIEEFAPVPYAKDQYGNFYEGDSYIILSRKTVGRVHFNLHYWLGSKTSQDEAGAAAIFSVQLDEHLGGVPIQYREVQDHESQLFLSYFKNGVRYLPGGVSSGFHHVDPDAFETKLYQVKGSRNVRVKRVEPTITSMNNGDCFILDVGKNIYVYVGELSKRIERLKAVNAANHIRDNDHAGHSKVEIIDASSSDSEKEEFFKILGSGSPSEIPTESQDDKQFETNQECNVRLYKISDMIPVEQETLSASNLNPEDWYLLDTGDSNIFIWKGKQSEKLDVVKAIDSFLDSKGYPSWTGVQRISQGNEPTAFTQYFKDWDESVCEKRLFHASIKSNTNRLHIEEIFDFKQDDLFSDDVMILDVLEKVYVWFGKGANESERSTSEKFVSAYLKKLGRDHIPVETIDQGEEDESFKRAFPSWNDDLWSENM